MGVGVGVVKVLWVIIGVKFLSVVIGLMFMEVSRKIFSGLVDGGRSLFYARILFCVMN